MTFDELENKHAGCRVFIIGKGPSLDHIDSIRGFLNQPETIVMALNESIRKVESLGIDNPLYAVQQDTHLGRDCIPKTPGAIHLMNAMQSSPSNDWPGCRKVSISQWNPDGIVYTIADESELSAVAALKIAKFMGVRSVFFACFDSWKTENGEYATCIGKDSGAVGDKARHAVNGAWIREVAKALMDSVTVL